MKARRQDQTESPWDYWRVQNKSVVRDALQRGNGVTTYELREDRFSAERNLAGARTSGKLYCSEQLSCLVIIWFAFFQLCLYVFEG